MFKLLDPQNWQTSKDWINSFIHNKFVCLVLVLQGCAPFTSQVRTLMGVMLDLTLRKSPVNSEVMFYLIVFINVYFMEQEKVVL